MDRTLFTNLDVTVTSFQRALCLTSIEAGHIHGDLAERLLPVELERIPDDKRKEDAQIAAEFAAYKPAILAGLFDLVADVLEVLPRVRPHNLPRMADFGRLLAALDEVKKDEGWQTLTAYRDAVSSALRSVVDDDAVAQAVVALVDAEIGTPLQPMDEVLADKQPDLYSSATWEMGQRWKGLSKDLLAALTKPDPAPKEWPQTPRGMRAVMTRLQAPLGAEGVDVTFGKRAKNRRALIVITRAQKEEPDAG